VVPCHRVVHADGSMGGYRGGGAVKRFLLRLERHRAHGRGRVTMIHNLGCPDH
ncbi:MGMT family protein, partial [Klebsiella pneumoniae]